MISKDIVKALPLALSTSENEQLGQLPTDNVNAYIFYTRGQEYFNQSWDQKDVQIALEMFTKAIEIDDEFSAAYAMISRCYASLYWDHYDYSPLLCQNAKRFPICS